MSWQQAPVVSSERRVSVLSAVIVGVGVAAIALWLFVLDFAGTSGFGSFGFADIRTAAGEADLTGLPGAWYAWIAYLSAVIAVVVAVVSLIPNAAQDALRVVAVVTAAAGLAVAFVALADDERGIDLGDRRIGFWVGMAGFVLLAVGAALPPRRAAVAAAPSGTSLGQQPWGAAPQQQPAAGADPWAVAAPAAPAAGPVVAAGWHPDPTGRNEQRWWDGQAWTPYVVRAGLQATDPL